MQRTVRWRLAWLGLGLAAAWLLARAAARPTSGEASRPGDLFGPTEAGRASDSPPDPLGIGPEGPRRPQEKEEEVRERARRRARVHVPDGAAGAGGLEHEPRRARVHVPDGAAGAGALEREQRRARDGAASGAGGEAGGAGADGSGR